MYQIKFIPGSARDFSATKKYHPSNCNKLFVACTVLSSSYHTKLSQSAVLLWNLFSSSSLMFLLLLELFSWLNSLDKANSSLNFPRPQRASSGVSSSKPFIVRSFLRYQVKRNEGPIGNRCRNSGIGVIEYCSVISTKLRCRLNLLLTFDGTYWWQQVACLSSALQNSTCSATDQACICADAALNAKVSICVQSSCNVKDQLSKDPPTILGFLSLTKT